jgi:hypothetical protein
MSIDNFLVDKLDRAMTWVQKRGVSLCHVHVFVAGLTLVTGLTSTRDSICFVLLGGFWGTYLYFTIAWSNRNAGYPLNWRKLNTLNAEALRYRETERRVRLFWFFSFLIFVSVDTIDYFIAGYSDWPHRAYCDFSFFCAGMTCWLNTASFIGFQPSTKRETSGVTQGAGA